jgi:hypothetical protein
LLEKGYSKLNEQKHSDWETFISEKKKLRVYLLPTANGTNCFFFTTKLVKAEIHLRSYSKYSKSKKINCNQILQKLQERKIRNNTASKKEIVKRKSNSINTFILSLNIE